MSKRTNQKNFLKGFIVFFKDAKFKFRTFVSSYPKLFFLWTLIRRKKYPNLIQPETELVIEGFPRSGNTFVVVAFNHSQKRLLIIGSHTHSAAQIINATNRKLPTIVLIRDPVDAVVSLVIREGISIKCALRGYICFYKRIYSYKDEYVVANFNDFTQDLGRLIDQVNLRYKTNYSAFSHTPQEIEKVFRIVEQIEIESSGSLKETHVARPSKDRKALARKVREILYSEYESLGEEANKIYTLFEEN